MIPNKIPNLMEAPLSLEKDNNLSPSMPKESKEEVEPPFYQSSLLIKEQLLTAQEYLALGEAKTSYIEASLRKNKPIPQENEVGYKAYYLVKTFFSLMEHSEFLKPFSDKKFTFFQFKQIPLQYYPKLFLPESIARVQKDKIQTKNISWENIIMPLRDIEEATNYFQKVDLEAWSKSLKITVKELQMIISCKLTKASYDEVINKGNESNFFSFLARALKTSKCLAGQEIKHFFMEYGKEFDQYFVQDAEHRGALLFIASQLKWIDFFNMTMFSLACLKEATKTHDNAFNFCVSFLEKLNGYKDKSALKKTLFTLLPYCQDKEMLAFLMDAKRISFIENLHKETPLFKKTLFQILHYGHDKNLALFFLTPEASTEIKMIQAMRPNAKKLLLETLPYCPDQGMVRFFLSPAGQKCLFTAYVTQELETLYHLLPSIPSALLNELTVEEVNMWLENGTVKQLLESVLRTALVESSLPKEEIKPSSNDALEKGDPCASPCRSPELLSPPEEEVMSMGSMMAINIDPNYWQLKVTAASDLPEEKRGLGLN